MIKKILLYFTLTIFTALIVFSTKSLVLNNLDRDFFSKPVFEEIDSSNKELINPPQDKEDAYYDYLEESYLSVDLEPYIKQNSDTVAYLKVPGTNIDYVVVQSQDNKYYLNHSFTKKQNKAGWVFSDYRNNLEDLKSNSIIYAHGRKDKTMFGTLEDTLKEEWFNNKDNHLIYLSTLKYNYIFLIFSVYKIPNETYYIKNTFLNKESYTNFLNTLKERSFFDFKTSLNAEDKIITLSTCKDLVNRIVVHAKLIKKGTK